MCRGLWLLTWCLLVFERTAHGVCLPLWEELRQRKRPKFWIYKKGYFMEFLLPLAQTTAPVIPSQGTQAPAPPATPTANPAAPTAEVATPAVSTGGATTTAPGGPIAPEAGKKSGGIGDMLSNPLVMMVPLFIVMYFLLFRGPRKEEKARKKMVSEMKRGDEVMTIGGLIGTVMEVREERVVIKVDEANNIKETYLKTAIQRVLSAEEEAKK